MSLCSPPAHFLPAAQQGPLKLVPAVAEGEGESCAMLVLPTLPTLVVLATTAGKVLICTALSSQPRWVSDTASAAKPLLFVLEVIDLSFGRPTRSVVLTPDPLHTDTLYAHHLHGVHKIHMPWLQRLTAFFDHKVCVCVCENGETERKERKKERTPSHTHPHAHTHTHSHCRRERCRTCAMCAVR